ncbi:hypothetical protein Bhyg_12038 [Pseudolycoriella hygida]|uniref:Uncharacterized protein n=1 Tax=Pseudolycoriella hygida TaxID=35572 RepID=A0A9Q0MWS8_9DIPT|nr:hypothetical protein Bhyg_12038 [Pseudolycoriella hygida]
MLYTDLFNITCSYNVIK